MIAGNGLLVALLALAAWGQTSAGASAKGRLNNYEPPGGVAVGVNLKEEQTSQLRSALALVP